MKFLISLLLFASNVDCFLALCADSCASALQRSCEQICIPSCLEGENAKVDTSLAAAKEHRSKRDDAGQLPLRADRIIFRPEDKLVQLPQRRNAIRSLDQPVFKNKTEVTKKETLENLSQKRTDNRKGYSIPRRVVLFASSAKNVKSAVGSNNKRNTRFSRETRPSEDSNKFLQLFCSTRCQLTCQAQVYDLCPKRCATTPNNPTLF